MTKARFSAALLAALATGAAYAQADFDKQIVNLSLLGIPAVSKDLKIQADQTRRLAAIDKEADLALDKLRQGKTPPTSAEMVKVAQAKRAKTLSVLSVGQITRLRELTLQTLGPLGVMNPSIQTKLNLSKTQKPKIASVFKEFMPKLDAASRPKDPKKKETPEDIKKRVAAIDKVNRDLAVAVRGVLTQAQLKQYRALVGKPCAGLRTAARTPL